MLASKHNRFVNPRKWSLFSLFLTTFLVLMMLATSLQGSWEVAQASHCGVGTGTGTGTGTVPTGTGIGTITGGNISFTVTVSASPTSVFGDGSSSSTITATVKTSGDAAIQNVIVQFRTTLGTITSGINTGTATSSTAATADGTTNVSGIALATLTSLDAGTATVDAIVKDNSGAARACPQTTVTFTASPPPGGGGGGGGGGTTPPPTTPPPTTPPPTTPPPGTTPTNPTQDTVIGNSTVDGGVSITVFAGTSANPINVSITKTNTSAGGTITGGDPLNITINVTASSGSTTASVSAVASALELRKPIEIVVNLTAAELAGRNINSIIGGGVTGTTIDPKPTRVINATEGTIGIWADHFSTFTLFAVTKPGPALASPAQAAQLTGLGSALQWSNPTGTTWYNLQLSAFNNDGLGINLVVGDSSQVAAAQFQVKEPAFGSTDPNYVMLPGMDYVWKVRTATTAGTPAEADWTSWSNPRAFKTAAKSSSTITLKTATVTSATPTLTWTNSDLATFYYEVQISKDQNFGTTAGAPFLYWELRHGGLTSPPNSYVVPSQFPLQAKTTYYWRVRPRVQGDGTDVAWTSAMNFQTP